MDVNYEHAIGASRWMTVSTPEDIVIPDSYEASTVGNMVSKTN